jgi:hypothetical protein
MCAGAKLIGFENRFDLVLWKVFLQRRYQLPHAMVAPGGARQFR